MQQQLSIPALRRHLAVTLRAATCRTHTKPLAIAIWSTAMCRPGTIKLRLTLRSRSKICWLILMPLLCKTTVNAVPLCRVLLQQLLQFAATLLQHTLALPQTLALLPQTLVPLPGAHFPLPQPVLPLPETLKALPDSLIATPYPRRQEKVQMDQHTAQLLQPCCLLPWTWTTTSAAGNILRGRTKNLGIVRIHRCPTGLPD